MRFVCSIALIGLKLTLQTMIHLSRQSIQFCEVAKKKTAGRLFVTEAKGASALARSLCVAPVEAERRPRSGEERACGALMRISLSASLAARSPAYLLCVSFAVGRRAAEGGATTVRARGPIDGSCECERAARWIYLKSREESVRRCLWIARDSSLLAVHHFALGERIGQVNFPPHDTHSRQSVEPTISKRSQAKSNHSATQESRSVDTSFTTNEVNEV